MPHLPKLPQKLDAFLREETGKMTTQSILALSAIAAAALLASAKLASAQTQDNSNPTAINLLDKPKPAHFHSHLSSPPGPPMGALGGFLLGQTQEENGNGSSNSENNG